MDLIQRLLIYIQRLGVSVAEFERNAGLSNGYINNFKGSLGVDKLESLLHAYPELSYDWLVRDYGVSADWLLTGRGDFYRRDWQSYRVSATKNRVL